MNSLHCYGNKHLHRTTFFEHVGQNFRNTFTKFDIYIFGSCTCIEYWHRVREVPSSIPSQAPRQHSTLKKGSTGMALSQELR